MAQLPTTTLARYVVQSKYEAIPERVRQEAKRALLNWLGCAIGTARHETIDSALAALDRGDGARHDALVAEAVAQSALDVDVVALAQFSLARAAGAVANVVQVPVLTTPASAVRALRARFAVG